MNKTKVIVTIGPSSEDIEIIRKLITNGADVVRLNLSHANHDFCTSIINKVRDIDKELNTNTAIMLDTKGPVVQIGKLYNGSANLKTGDKIRIYMNDVLGDSTKFSVDYPNLVNDVKQNTIIKINDGLVELVVLEKETDCLICEVKNGGTITDNKCINIINTKLNIPFLNKNDLEDIIYADKMDIDFLALSFVSSSEDVLEINDKLIELGNDHIEIISKIENENAVNDLDNIIRVSDGIMVARGDLSVEIAMERVPAIQKNIIHKCHNAGKVSIVATEMLSSMEIATRPTRAEVSDIANAVLDGTDAVMLCGETTIGKYPVETLQVMEKIIKMAELDINYLELLERALRTDKQDITGMIAYNVTESANRLKCKAIVAPTISGYTARKISRFRPTCPIIAMSPSEKTIKSLSLHFGIKAVKVDELNSFDKIINKAISIEKKLIPTEVGDKIIITGGYPFKQVKHTNFMKIEEL